MPLDTALSRRLGLRYPLVAAPMFLISNKEMIVACAEAGILGTMPSLNARTTAALADDIAWIQARTDRPFGINLTIGLTPPERLEADVELVLERRVPVLITSYGNPTQIVQRARAVGTTVFHDVVHLKHAFKAQAAGVDAIIGVAAGAGGHAGRISPFVLVPYLREHLDVPVIAAGCIHGGQQVVAALALGAELAYMGTRFIASEECGAQAAYKQMLLDAQPDDIVYTDKVSGVHANFLKGSLPDESPGTTDAKRWRDIWSAGQGSALVHQVKPVAEIVQEVMAEAREVLGRLV